MGVQIFWVQNLTGNSILRIFNHQLRNSSSNSSSMVVENFVVIVSQSFIRFVFD